MKTSPERRALLTVAPSPAGKQDFLVQIEYLIWLNGGSAHLVLRYVPDLHVLDSASLKAYAEQFATFPPDQLEVLAAMLQEDFSNIIIPRFLHIELSASSAKVTHRVVVEERQPRWNNQALLSRLKAL